MYKTTYQAGGDIRPRRFVKNKTNGTREVLEADASERTCGISHESTKQAPFSGSSALAAADGEQLSIYGPNDECELEIGSGGCTAGDLLASDADGCGVTNTTDKRWYGARALETGLQGEFVRVVVEHGYGAF